MKNLSIITILALGLFACNNEEKNNPEKTDSSSNTIVENSVAPVSGTYMQVIERDTIVADLQQNGDKITGTLKFDNYQKDGSSGTVKGYRSGDTLKLLYDFHSEGMKSVMDIFFLMKDDSLIRGVGDMDVKGDTAYFIDPARVTYPANTSFKKIDDK